MLQTKENSQSEGRDIDTSTLSIPVQLAIRKTLLKRAKFLHSCTSKRLIVNVLALTEILPLESVEDKRTLV